MPKNILQDIIPKNQRSIRRIPIPERHPKQPPVEAEKRHTFKEETLLENEVNNDKPKERIPKSKSKERSGKRKFIIIFIIVAVVIAGGIVLSTVFAHVTVTVYPKKYSVQTSATIVAKKNPLAGEVQFTTTEIVLEKSVSVPAKGEKIVEKRATGTVIVYNNDSNSKQRLIINTRLETSSGLIFRLTESVVVPGKTTVNGKVIPGSIEAKIQADDIGPKFNVGLTDFTIPGFKGTDKFNKFFARSKTPMTGGFSGTIKVVDEVELETKKKELRTELDKEVRLAAAEKVPRNDTYFPSLLSLTFTDLPDSSPDKNSVTVKTKVVALAPTFKLSQLGQKLAEVSLKENSVKNFILKSTDKLIVSPTQDATLTSNSFSFTVKGPADFWAHISAEEIAQLLAGKSQKAFNQALSGLNGIERAEATVRPMWRISFPKDTSRIETRVILD